MGDHSHQDNKDVKNLKVAFFLNLCFTVVEIIGGFLTNSLAILSDALHDMGDSFSLGLAWYLQKVSKKGRSPKFTYGYRRFSLLGAIINSFILFAGSLFIITRAIGRMQHVEEADPKGMVLLALLGIAVNGLAVYRLKKGTSQNERVVTLHLMEDVLGWVAVLIGSIVIYFTEWYIIDAILSLLIALYVMVNAFKNLRKSVKIVLQALPDQVDYQRVEESLLQIEGVSSIHDLHIWSLDGERNVLTVHMVVNRRDDSTDSTIKKEAKRRMADLDIAHCTLELEQVGDDCEDQDNDD